MMNGRHAWAVLWTALLMALPASYAQGCGPYRVAFYEFGAMYFRDGRLHEGGVDKDVLEEVARRTRCAFTTSVASRVATWVYMAKGTADITTSSIRTEDRERNAAFAIYMKGDLTLFVRSELAGTVDSLHTFVTRGHWKLAVAKGFSYGPKFDAMVADLRERGRVAEYSDPTVVARIMALGRADAFIASELAWQPIIKAHQLEGRVTAVHDPKAPVVEAGLAFSKARVAAPDIQRMTEAVDEMRADGTLAKILERHGTSEIARRALP